MVYALISRLLVPAAWWGRLRATGLELVPERGPVVIVPNHDSQWDPVILGVALRKRRALRFLARANLWKIRGLGPVMNGMRQIPIERGAGDAQAMSSAVVALEAGDAVCVFPEGKLSLGERLPARSGVARLIAAGPAAPVVLCAISGTTDYVRFPRRPHVRVELFPLEDPVADGEPPRELAARLLEEVRRRVPPAAPGRRPSRPQESAPVRVPAS